MLFRSVVFPGSNCDRDMAWALQGCLGLPTRFLWHGDTDLAGVAAMARAALHNARTLGWSAAVVRAIEYLALVAAESGDAPRAARLLGFTAALYARGGASRESTERYCYDRLCDRLEAALDLDRIEALMIDGETLPEERAVEIALR